MTALCLGAVSQYPPAAKLPFSGWRRRKEKIDLAVFQYSFAQFLPCSLPSEKIQPRAWVPNFSRTAVIEKQPPDLRWIESRAAAPAATKGALP